MHEKRALPLLEKKVDNEKVKDEVAATIEKHKSTENFKLAVAILIAIISLVTSILKLIIVSSS